MRWCAANARGCSTLPSVCARARSSRSQGQAFNAGGEYRHWRLRSRACHGRRSTARIQRRCAARGLRLQCGWLPARRCTGARRPGAHAVHYLLQDLHDAGDPQQCAGRARVAARQAGRGRRAPAFCRRFGQCARHGRVWRASRLPIRHVGLGGWPLFPLVVDRRLAGDRDWRAELHGLPRGRRRNGPAFSGSTVAGAICRCCPRCSACGMSTSWRCPRSPCCPTISGSRACRRICSSSRWRATASRCASMAAPPQRLPAR